MVLTENTLQELINIYIEKTKEEIRIANEKGRLEEYLKSHKQGSLIENECAHCFLANDYKILIVGPLVMDKNELYEVAEEYAIDRSQIEFLEEYKRITNFDFDMLINSGKYSDIIFGALPHKTKGTHGASGILAYLKNNRDRYPNIVEARAGAKLKLTRNTFKHAIEQTNYYKFICI